LDNFNVSIPVLDLLKSKKFYQLFFPYKEEQEILFQPLFKNEESIFFGDRGLGLRLFRVE
jgi:hypothetical protein